MKKHLLLMTLCTLFWVNKAGAQYWTSGGEIIFSFADYRDSTNLKISGPPRFTVFFHVNYKYNIDLGNSLGLAFGMSVKNVGWITTDETYALASDVTDVRRYDKIKRRSYNLGVPLMLKIGNMKKNKFLVLGGEYELLFHFKEKRFIGGEKLKRRVWLSDETNRFLPSVFVGLQFSKIGMVKFQYYLDDFLNTGYKNGSGQMPYTGMKSQMMYVSWMGNMRTEDVKSPVNKKKKDEFSARARMIKAVRINY